MRVAVPFGPYRGQGPRRLWDNLAEGWRRTPWPAGAEVRDAPAVAVVTVNYNTAELTAHLLYSLFRVLEPRSLARVVVVDNDSDDGSAALLSALRDRGLIDLVRNQWLTYHGPGLNRGLSHLARLQQRGAADTDLVWVLDSDVVVLRPQVLTDAVRSLTSNRAALAAELGPEEPALLPKGCFYVSSMLIDPGRAWRRGVRPFWEHGSPGAGMQRSLEDRREPMVEFPFYRDQYLLHLGQGTLDRLVARNDRANRYYQWATRPRSYTYHYSGNPDGARHYDAFLRRFQADVPVLSPDALAGACQLQARVSFPL